MDLKDLKLDLVYLKKLVAELEVSAEAAEKKKQENVEGIPHDYLIELSKVNGILGGVMQEAKMLTGDIAQLIRYSTVPQQQQTLTLQDLYGEVPGKDPFGGSFN